MSSKVIKKKQITDEERSALVKRLQDDIEDFVAEKSLEAQLKRQGEEDTDKSIDEIAEELKNHPAFMKEVDWSKPLSDEMQGLMQLKYECEDPVARANSYKEEGNELFQKKDYRVAIENYTEGIKSKSPDKEQNAILYTNRAAAQFHLGNYRSAFKDCIFARKFKADHFKAILRGAQCCAKTSNHVDTMRWCAAGCLLVPDHKELTELKLKAETAKRVQDRDERKQAAQERKEEETTVKLVQVIESRHIHLATIKRSAKTAHLNPALLYDLDPLHPSGACVQLDEKGVLYWPVIFMYPEYAQTDFIESFCENHRFEDHLITIFGVEAALWDVEHKYTPDGIQIYFQDQKEEKLYAVSRYNTLLEVLQHKRYVVYKGTPTFFIVVKDSVFHREFIKKNQLA